MPPAIIENSTTLRFLWLSNNRLQGEILPGNSSLEYLECLEFDGNEFTTSLNISNTPNLEVLNIRNNHLSGDISSWLHVHSFLFVRFLGGNRFEGPIPWQICQLKSLQFLDLSNTTLVGTIPSCLASVRSWINISLFNSEMMVNVPIGLITKGISYNYTGVVVQQMILIDLSLYKLTGTIPFEFGYMTGVWALNLSLNLLEGPLPVSFENMKNLESLDLSHNKLTGKIPQEITNLNFLSTFNVAFNNLSGEIPTQGQFLTFSGSSYKGNPGLCGEILKINCSSNAPLNNNNEERGRGGEEDGILENDLFYYLCGHLMLSRILGLYRSSHFQQRLEAEIVHNHG